MSNLNEDQFRITGVKARVGPSAFDDDTERITVSETGASYNGYSWDKGEFPRGVISYTPPSERPVHVATPEYRHRTDLNFPVVKANGEVASPEWRSSGVAEQQTWLSPNPGGLDDFYVHPAHQGRGFGSLLLNAAQDYHQQRFGRGSVIGTDPDTTVSKDTVNVVKHYGASSIIEDNGKWDESKGERDDHAAVQVYMASNRVRRHGPESLGREIHPQTSLQDKLHRAGFTPEAAPPPDGSKQLSMLSGKKSSAPRVKKKLL